MHITCQEKYVRLKKVILIDPMIDRLKKKLGGIDSKEYTQVPILSINCLYHHLIAYHKTE